MLSAVGSIGHTYIVKSNDVFYYKDASVLCLENIYHINPFLISFWMKTDLLMKQMYENSKGTTVDTITLEKLNSYLIPLPPLAEQHRIVTRIEKWSALIDAIELDKTDLQTSIKQAKTTILDMAIRGNLVPQDPNDEPASELLKRHGVSSDSRPYGNVPKGWAICNLEDITEYEQPQNYIVSSTNYADCYDTPVLTAGKSFVIGYTNDRDGIYVNLPVIIFDDFTTESKYVDFPFKVKSSAMKILKVKDEIVIKYVSYFMSITRLVGKTHKRYWISEYSKLPIPLPPIAEQHRIVAKIEELFSQLDTIANTLE